jgi:predicted metal-dependent HD superfamily phosphohydrolase
MSENILLFLENKWIQLCNHGSVNVKSSKDWWQKIKVLLTEEHRFYHNFSHIYRLYQHFEEYKELTSKDATHIYELSIFFHE